MLVDLQGRMDVEAEYQRGLVWSDAQQKLLIDSLLRGFDVPKLYLRRNATGSTHLFQVVDGKQRLTAIWRFFQDELPLPRGTIISGLGDLGRKTFSELPTDAQDVLQFRVVSVTEIQEATDDDVAEQFLRLQRGEPLNAAEKRRAIAGPARSMVAGIQRAHSELFQVLGLPNRRFAWDELSAIAILLVRAGGPTSLKGADLTELYEQSEIDSDGRLLTEVGRILDDLEQIAACSVGAIKTRWAYVDLVGALLERREELERLGPQEVMNRFLRFEIERRAAGTALSDFVISGGEEEEALRDLGIESDMFRYVQAFAREGARRENIQIRVEVLTARLTATP